MLSHAQSLQVEWARKMDGGSLYNAWADYWHEANTCAVDPFGNLAVVSYYGGAGVVGGATPGEDITVPDAVGGGDILVARYGADGVPSWAFTLGSVEIDAPTGVFADHHGNIYVSAFSRGALDVDPGPGEFIVDPADGDQDMLILKYDSTGAFVHAIHWEVPFVNPYAGQVSRMGMDAAGNLYIAGFFCASIVLGSTGTPGQLTGADQYTTALVAKYDPDGLLLDYFALPADQQSSTILDLVVEPDGGIFITGDFNFGIDMDPGPGDVHLNGWGLRNAFFARYDADLQLQWAHTLEGTNEHVGIVACPGHEGGYVVGGWFSGNTTFHIGGEPFTYGAGSDGSDLYLLGIGADGAFTWVRRLAASGNDLPMALAAKSDNTFYFSFTWTGHLNLDQGVSDHTFSNTGLPHYDMGLARYRMDNGAFLSAHAYGSGGGVTNYADIEILDNALYMVGLFSDQLNVDIPNGGPVLTTTSSGALAVVKYCHVPGAITLSVEGEELVLCPGTDTTITAFGAEQFHWYTVPDGGIPIASGPSITLVADTSVTFYVEGRNGSCAGQRVPLSVVVRPRVDIVEDTVVICAGDTVQLHYTGLADSFTFSDPAVFTTGLPFFADAIMVAEAFDAASSCSTSDTAWVVVKELPFVDLVLSPDTACLLDGSVTLTGGSPAGGTWSSDGEIDGDQFLPLMSGPGTFAVFYTVEGENGCSATAQANIHVAVCIGTAIGGTGLPAGVRVFPQPARSELFVEHDAGIGQAVLMDATGRTVRTAAGQGTARMRVDVHGLAPGRYVLRLTMVEGTLVTVPVLLAH